MTDQSHVSAEFSEEKREEVPAVDQDKLYSKEILSHAALFRVACEVGHVQMSYDELGHLKTGQVLPFESTTQQVYITIDGTRVGEGILVEVDGKIGVKVTRWYR